MSLGDHVFLKSLFKRNFLLSIAASNASLWSKLSSLTNTSLVCQCEKWPQGPFLRPCGPIGWDASHQEGSRESGHKAIKNAIGAISKNFPKGLFYGLVARFSRILLLGASQPIAPQGRRKGPWGHFLHCPKGLFYGLVARFSVVARFGGKCPSQSPIRPEGHRKVP
jgi:hypothetical protein